MSNSAPPQGSREYRPKTRIVHCRDFVTRPMKDPRFAKFVVFINSLVPLSLLLWDAYWNHLGANPVEFAIRTTGMLALVFLILCLCVTPLRKITGRNWFSHFRKMLGLYAFFYGLTHLSIYFWLDRSLSIRSLIADTAAHPFIL